MFYVLAGLYMEYNPLVTSMLARSDPASYSELLSQMLSFESRLDLLTQAGGGSQSSANSASRSSGGQNPSYCGGSGRGRGAPGGRVRGGSNGCGRGPNNGGQKPRYNGRCQVFFKEGHNAANCWHRFDAEYVPNEKTVNSSAHGYAADGAWYTDTGATDYITSELDKLVLHDKYHGNDQIRTANGACMNINRIGTTIVSTPNCNL